MSKKLLSEAVVRRFAKLANLEPVNEEWGGNQGDYKRRDGKKIGDVDGHYKDYEEKNENLKEDAFEDEAEMGADAAEGELDDAEMGGLDAEAGLEDAEAGDEVAMDADLGEREALAMDVISAVADALNIEVDIEGAEPEMDDELEVAAGEDEAVADELDMDAIEDEEEAIMEALKGINYVPGKKEIVNEVAKRVARRLLKAQKAEKQLKEALGSKSHQSPRRRRK